MRNEDELSRILNNPASVYHSPYEVLDDEQLNEHQKFHILRSWEQDERELAVADEEGMSGGERNILADILAAINHLHLATNEPDAPTKQGGHS